MKFIDKILLPQRLFSTFESAFTKDFEAVPGIALVTITRACASIGSGEQKRPGKHRKIKRVSLKRSLTSELFTVMKHRNKNSCQC